MPRFRDDQGVTNRGENTYPVPNLSFRRYGHQNSLFELVANFGVIWQNDSHQSKTKLMQMWELEYHGLKQGILFSSNLIVNFLYNPESNHLKVNSINQDSSHTLQLFSEERLLLLCIHPSRFEQSLQSLIPSRILIVPPS